MDQQAHEEWVYEKGWTDTERRHWNDLSQDEKREEASQRQMHQRRLEFVRWLVLTGKLTENIA